MILVYVTTAWVLGIWLSRLAWSWGFLGCNRWSLMALAGLLVLPVIGLVFGRNRARLRLPATLLLCLLLGGIRYQLHPLEPCFDSEQVAFYNGTATDPSWATITGVVVRPPEDRDTRARIRLRADAIVIGEEGKSRPAQGDVLFSVDRYPELHYGDRLSVRGRLEHAPVFEDFDYRAYLARQGVHTIIERPEVTVLARGQGSLFWRTLYRLRLQGQEVIARMLPEPEAALLTGIVLGVETGIDRGLYDQFNITGTSHLIVISGSNIAVIAGVLTALLGRLIGRRLAFYPVVAGILLYTLLVGADGSVTRAAIMGILYAWATYLGRQSTAIVSLFFAGLLMTLINPLTLWDVGFQLSFMATLSLILFTPGMTERGERIVARLLPAGMGQSTMNLLNDALIVTLAAQVLTLPLVAYYFQRVSIVSPLANLLVLPVQPPVMVLGGLAVIVGLLAALLNVLWPLARLIALTPWLALHWTVLVVQFLAPLSFASLNTDINAMGLVAFYGTVGMAMLSGRSTLPVVGSLLHRARELATASGAITLSAVALVVVSGLCSAAFRDLPDGKLHVHFLGVERGEAVLIETPDGQQVLVDGGYGSTELLSALGEHMPFYDREIELVVLTHPGDERIGGLVGLPERFRIGQVLQAPFPYRSAAYETWLRALRARGVPITAAEAGTRVHLGHGITLDVLHPGPEPALRNDGELDLAANSLVLRLSYGETSFLLTGDATEAVQDQLVAWGLQLAADVVKLPDGGRQAAFSKALLEATHPQHAVVFAQREDRFRDLSSLVEEAWIGVVGVAGFHRTDLAGTVTFVSDGKQTQSLLQGIAAMPDGGGHQHLQNILMAIQGY